MELERAGDADRVRVSDIERQQTVQLLGDAAAEGRLTLEEYTERTGAAYAAVTRADLARLTTDLPAEGTLAGPASSPPAEPPGRPERLLAVFGSDSRRGHWLVPRSLRTKSIFGEVKIEMQDAQLQHPVTTIEATVAFGATTVYVPEGVDVRLIGYAVFGAKDSRMRTPPRPGAPVVEVRCKVWFGSVEVKPSE